MMELQLSENVQKVIYTLLTLTLVWSSLFAQEVQEKELRMSLGPQNGFTIDIDGVDKGFVEDRWDDFMKDQKYGKTKRNKKADEYFGNEIKIPMVNGASEFSLYAKFDERVDLVTVNVWADMKGYFANSDESESEAEGVKQFLKDFYLVVKRKAFDEEKEEKENILKRSEKDLEKLVDKNKDLHEDIADLEKKIREKEEEIATNLTDQEKMKTTIEQDRANIDEVSERINNLGKGM